MSQTVKQESFQNEKINDTEENNFDEDLDEEINGYLNQLEEIPLDLFDETCGNSSDGSKNTQNTSLETPSGIDTQHLVPESSLPHANNEKSDTAASISLLAKTILSVLEKKKEDFKKSTLDGGLNENLTSNDVFLQLSSQISQSLDRKFRKEPHFGKAKSSESLLVGPSGKRKRDGKTSKKMTNNTKLHLVKETTTTMKTEAQELGSHIEDGIKTQVVPPKCSVVKQEPKDDNSIQEIFLSKGGTRRKRRNSSSSSSSSLSGMETVILPTRVSSLARSEKGKDVPSPNEPKDGDLSCVSSSESLLHKISDGTSRNQKREPSPFPISKNSRKNSVDDKTKDSDIVRIPSDCSKVSSVSDLDFEMEPSLEQNHERKDSPTFHHSRSRTRSKRSYSRSRSRTMSNSPRRKGSNSPSRRQWKSSAYDRRDGKTLNLKTHESYSKSPSPIVRSVIGYPSEKKLSSLKHTHQKPLSRSFDDEKLNEESKVPESKTDTSEKDSSKFHEAESETADNTAPLNSETLDSSDARNVINYRSLSPSSSNGSRSPRRRRYRSGKNRRTRWSPSRSPPRRRRRRSNSGSPRRKRLRYRRSFSRSISPRRRRSRSMSRSPHRRSPLRKRYSRSRSPYWVRKSPSPKMSSKRSHSPWSSPRQHRRSSSMSISPSPDDRRTKLKEHAVNSLVAALKGASASAAVESLVAVLSGASPTTLSRTSIIKALPTTDPTQQITASATLPISNQIISTAKVLPTSLPALPEPPKKPVPPVQSSETQQIQVHTGYPYPSHGNTSMSPECYPSYQFNQPPPPLPAAPYSDPYYQGGYEGAGSSYIVSTSVQHTYGPYNQMSYQHQTYFQSQNFEVPVPFLPSVPPPPPPGEQPPLPPPLPEDYPPPPPPEPEPLSDDKVLPVLNSMNRRKLGSNFVSPLINRLQSNLRYLLPEVTKNKPSADALKIIDKALRSPEKITSSPSSSSSSPVRQSPTSEDGLSRSSDKKFPINVPKKVDDKTDKKLHPSNNVENIEKHSKHNFLSSESFKLAMSQTVKNKSPIKVPSVTHQKTSALGESDVDCEMMQSRKTEEIRQRNTSEQTKTKPEDLTHRKCKPVVLKLLPRKTLPIFAPSTLFQSDDSEHEYVSSKSHSNQIFVPNQEREGERHSSKKTNMLELGGSKVCQNSCAASSDKRIDVYSPNTKIQSRDGKTPQSSPKGIFSPVSFNNTVRTHSKTSGSGKCLASQETPNKAYSSVCEMKEKSKTLSQMISNDSSPLKGSKIPTLCNINNNSSSNNNNNSNNNNLILVKTEPDVSNESNKLKFPTSVVVSSCENTLVTANIPTSTFKIKQENNCTSVPNTEKEIASKLLTETSKTGRKQNSKTVDESKKENKEITQTSRLKVVPKVLIASEGFMSEKEETVRKATEKVKDVIIKNECLLGSTDAALSTNLVIPTNIPLPTNLVDPTNIPLPNCSSVVKSTHVEDVTNIILPKDKEYGSLSVAEDLINQNTPVSPSGNKENLSLNIPSVENSNEMSKTEGLITSGNVLSENAMDEQHCEAILQPSGNSKSGKKDDMQENVKQLQNSVPIDRKTDTSQFENSENGVQTVPNLCDKSTIKEENKSDGSSPMSNKNSKCRTTSTSKKEKPESELSDVETTVTKSIDNDKNSEGYNSCKQKNAPTTFSVSLNVEVLDTVSKPTPTDIKCRPKSKKYSQKENITDKHERTCNTTNQKKDLKLNIVEKQIDVSVSKADKSQIVAAVNELPTVHIKPSTVVSKALSTDKKCESGDSSLIGNVLSEHKRRKVNEIKKIRNLFDETERKIILGASLALSDPKLMKCAVIVVERNKINKNHVKKKSFKLELETTGNYSTSEDEHVRQLEKSREDAHKLPSKETAKRLQRDGSSTSAENSLADTHETVVSHKDESMNEECDNNVNSISDKEALQQAIKHLNISSRTISTQVNIVKGVLCGSEEITKTGTGNRHTDLVNALKRVLRFMTKEESAE